MAIRTAATSIQAHWAESFRPWLLKQSDFLMQPTALRGAVELPETLSDAAFLAIMELGQSPEAKQALLGALAAGSFTVGSLQELVDAIAPALSLPNRLVLMGMKQMLTPEFVAYIRAKHWQYMLSTLHYYAVVLVPQ